MEKILIVETHKQRWQETMERYMKNNKRFLLITRDSSLARAFSRNTFKFKELKKILWGGGVVIGVGWGAKLASASALLAILDPEFITKKIFAFISLMTLIFGGYWVLRLSRYLMQGKYHFVLRERNLWDEWEIEANPREGMAPKLGRWLTSDQKMKNPGDAP